jgi:hypothetical protein
MVLNVPDRYPDPVAMQPIPNCTCPLCGEPNECAVAKFGTFDVECWCAKAKVSEAALARVPEALRGKACLCSSCASREQSGYAKPAGK